MIKFSSVFFFLFGFFVLMFSCASSQKAPAAMDYESNEASGYNLKSERTANTGNTGRMVAYSASLSLSVKNCDETRKNLIEQVKNANGFITKETESVISARIPSENMDSFITGAKTLGKTENESKTGTDITDQYRDDIIRLESMKTVRNRYLALLEKAVTVSDILSIEKELERINSGIEILEGKIKYAELSVSYSNISVRFSEKARPGPVSWIFYGLYHGIKWLFVWG